MIPCKEVPSASNLLDPLRQSGIVARMVSERAITIAFGLESDLSVRGGVNVLVETLIEGLPTNWEVVLISTDPPGIDPATLHPRIKHHVHWTMKPTSRASAAGLAQALADLRVDIVHLHGGIFGFGMRFPGHCPFRHLKALGIGVIWTNHTWVSVLSDFCGPQKPLWFKLGFLPLAWSSRVRELRALDYLIAVSDYTLKKEKAWYWPAGDRMKLIYHSTSSEAHLRPPTQCERTVVSVGHIAWRKGQLLLARAFARVAKQFPEWKLLIIGGPCEPDYSRELEEFVKDQGDQSRIELLGSQPNAARFISNAGIFVQPSVWEGLPIALQEAMFHGRPCVATNCQGNNELIQDGQTGILVPVNEEEALAAALARMMGDTDLRIRFGLAAQASVLQRGMTIEAMMRLHLDLYEKISNRAAA